ncbi:acyltransferase family protein [Echinicola rosea]|uniref:Membrane protein n=1 Tax=Echinicola rosea TaxID=1807691 RepID=A0ABQ1VB21_9BACT|nr:heparan-alpha-glucosaminide N-acetyltransferase domain-containing protein [Echinicola rosea]GGF46231.1 membrane protein [Echinicola rosea]
MANKSKRLISLDALRGITIAAMILVNFPGSWDHVFPPLHHAHWNGITPTDFIFPFFLFIVGVSIVMAYSGRLDGPGAKGSMYRKVFFRGAKIFLLGILLGMIPAFDFSAIRVAGVLQRIAVVFVVCTILFINLGWKRQAYLALILLVGYWLAMTLIPTPGLGEVVLEPGRNLAAWIDQQLLPGKMWQGDWDPEGLFSTFPAVATGILGMLAGQLLKCNLKDTDKANNLMIVGLILTLWGVGWAWFFPINKNLWTSSFVLVTGGVAFSFLGALYYWIDIKGHKQGTRPWVIFGSNAITVYVLADLLSLVFYQLPLGEKSISEHFMHGAIHLGMMDKIASMVFAMCFVAINYIPAWLLYRKGVFIKL